MFINTRFIELKSKMEKSTALERLIAHLIMHNKSIIIGSDKPKERMKELQEKFPEAKFKLCRMGVRLLANDHS